MVKPYKAGNGENTGKLVEGLKKMNPHQEMLLIGDGASYHRGQAMQQLLMRENDCKSQSEWSITCC